MIVYSDSAKTYPCKVIGLTDAGEKAYYVEPEPGNYSDGKTECFSRSGRPWLPNVFDDRLTCFIAGAPGAGKSYLATQLIKMFPEKYKILLFTALEENDGNFDCFKDRLYKIKMTPENLARITLSSIRERCEYPILLFDDIDKIRDKRVEKQIFALLEDALANGRGHKKHDGAGDIHTIVTSHALNDYKKTKYTLENSNYIALFPGATTFRQLETMFNKLGLSPDLCRDVFELGKNGFVRSIIIHKNVPMYLIGNQLIKLI